MIFTTYPTRACGLLANYRGWLVLWSSQRVVCFTHTLNQASHVHSVLEISVKSIYIVHCSGRPALGDHELQNYNNMHHPFILVSYLKIHADCALERRRILCDTVDYQLSIIVMVLVLVEQPDMHTCGSVLRSLL